MLGSTDIDFARVQLVAKSFFSLLQEVRLVYYSVTLNEAAPSRSKKLVF